MLSGLYGTDKFISIGQSVAEIFHFEVARNPTTLATTLFLKHYSEKLKIICLHIPP